MKYRIVWSAGIVIAVLLLVALAAIRRNRHRLPAYEAPVTGAPNPSHGAATTARMSEADRKYIWDAEGVAFQLIHKAAPQLSTAIEREDRAAFSAFLADDFRGQILPTDSAEVCQREFGAFRFQSASKQKPLEVGKEEFVEWLLDYARVFRATRQVQFSLLYLSPMERDQMDAGWIGTWTVRMYGELGDGQNEPAPEPAERRTLFPRRNATGAGPLGEVVIRGRFGWGRKPNDFERDRAWIRHWEIERAVVARSTHLLMQDATADTGIEVGLLRDNWTMSRRDFEVTAGGVYACDYNDDGETDLLFTDRGTTRLYAGIGGARFQDVTLEAGLQWEQFPGLMAMLADLDNDGDEDLVLTGGVFENRAGQFIRRGALKLDTPPVGASVGDYDRDGLVDLYLSHAAPTPNEGMGRTSWIDDQSGIPNRLFRNRGNFQFEDVTDAANAGAGRRSKFTSVWLDADTDGWPDIYVINELGANVLLRNEHNGRFSEIHIGPEHDGFAMGVAAGDVDGDGRIDLYLGNMYSKAGERIVANVPSTAYAPEILRRMQRFVSGNMLLLNRGNSQFEEVDAGVSAVGWAYGPTLIDLDGDGLLDIHSVCGFASFSRDEPDG